MAGRLSRVNGLNRQGSTMTSAAAGTGSLTEHHTLQVLVGGLSAYGNRQAVLTFHKDEVHTWSYGELSVAVSRLASGLLAAGLSEGESVALYSPNRIEWIIACLALLQAGAVPVPIDSQITSDDLAHVLTDSQARWVMTIRSLLGRLTPAGLDRDRSIILLDAGEDDLRSLRRFQGDPTKAMPSVLPTNRAILFYTSGVSGRPKGVPLSHGNLLSNLHALTTVRVYCPDERLLLPLPLHHVYPFMVGLLAPLAQGLPIILPHSLTGPQILRALREGRVTAIVGVPRIYAALYATIERRIEQNSHLLFLLFRTMLDCSSLLLRRLGLPLGRGLFAPLRTQFAPQLRTMVSGGSPLAPDLAWKLAGLGWRIAAGYGLTETSPILTFTAPGSRRFDTAGTPLPGVRLRISDSDPETGQGEVQTKGSNVFAGYLHLPHKTAEAFTKDGWFKTGDLGYLDQSGYLHLVGRASSRITLPGGEKIWPERVEEILDGGPSVHEAGVFDRGGRLVGIIVPQAAVVQAGELDQLTQAIRVEIDARLRLLPSYCRLTDFIISFDPLPRTRLGKIQRHKLKGLYDAGKQRTGTALVEARPIPVERMAPEDRQLLEDPVAARLWDWLVRRFPAVRLTPDTSLSLELGWDSLEWLAITLELRDQLGIELREDALARVVAVRDLLREAAEAEEAAGPPVDPLEQLANPETLLDQEQRRWLAARGLFLRGIGAILFFLDRLFMRTLFSLEVHGVEHVPSHGSWVMTPNHVSLLDAPSIIAALEPPYLHRTYWGGWTGIMFRNLVMRFVSRATLVLPVDQSSRPLANLALGVAALARGHNLVWFPEGDRSRDGNIQPFQPGIGLILSAHPVPVIPVLIQGTFEALPRGARWPRRGHIRIIFGEVLHPDKLAGGSKGTDRYRRIAQSLHDRVVALGDPASWDS